MKYTLIIDTSTEKNLFALALGRELLYAERMPLRCSEGLGEAVKNCFTHFPEADQELKTIAVTIALSTLMGYVSEKEGLFASLIDARSRGAFVLQQVRRGSSILALSEPQLIEKERVPSLLRECIEIVGPSFERWSLMNMREGEPNAERLAEIAEEKWRRGEATLDLELLY
jgi:tRNA A37 threonylcarbamoyladenosine modification protein TsaB